MISLRTSTLTILFVCTLAAATACSSSSRSSKLERGVSLSQNVGEGNETEVKLDFSLTNFTGASLRAVYLSHTTSPGWEENILSGTELRDGDTVNIRFNPNEKTIEWDMRIEGVTGRYAEWKILKLGELSQITLVLKPSTVPVVVAEVE